MPAKTRSFKRYCEERDAEAQGHKKAPDIEGLVPILRVAATEAYDKLLDFFEKLAQEHPHVRDELDMYKRHALDGEIDKPVPPTDHKDAVVPNSADGGGVTTEPDNHYGGY